MNVKPNVVFLQADNLGYGDVGCYGSAGEMRGMPTPNMDKLAREGLRFNQFMVEAACTPSWAAPYGLFLSCQGRPFWPRWGSGVATTYTNLKYDYLALNFSP